MASRRNPLQLNALQLKTLTLLQEPARLPAFPPPADEAGDVANDPSGRLKRWGLVRPLEQGGPALTRLGRDYPTGLRAAILHKPVD
jgi:hypothetical protein